MPRGTARLIVFRSSKNGQWYYLDVASNGRVRSASEGYTRHYDALKAARKAIADPAVSVLIDTDRKSRLAHERVARNDRKRRRRSAARK